MANSFKPYFVNSLQTSDQALPPTAPLRYVFDVEFRRLHDRNIAQELERLAKLHAEDALTSEEFAKGRSNGCDATSGRRKTFV
jgi:hypothetical protein